VSDLDSNAVRIDGDPDNTLGTFNGWIFTRGRTVTGECHDRELGTFIDRLERAPQHEVEEYADFALTLCTWIDLIFMRRFPDARTAWCTRVRETALSELDDAPITGPS
jgi:hypothetical protein